MLNKRAKKLRRCKARTLNGFGPQCSNYSKFGFNLCGIHLAADNRKYLSDSQLAFKKMMGKHYKIGKGRKRNICKCQAYNFTHQIGQGLCNFPLQPKQRLEAVSSKENILFRQKLKRRGIKLPHLKERNPDSKLIDLDFDPTDLSMEEDYLRKMTYVVDVMSLPIEERRKIKKQKLITEYLLKIGALSIDEDRSKDFVDLDDLEYIDGKKYKIK
jgi:hypothetical protein